jgi:Phytanoyl-CoA dioxygenase (PhyH)
MFHEDPDRGRDTPIRRYGDTDYLAPVRVLSTTDAAEIRAKLEAFEAIAGPLAGKLRQKSHLLFTWLDDLIRHERILDAVEDFVGGDILCWGTSFFIKEPRDPSFVSWHQDSTYWGLEPAHIVTAWIALSDSTVENGAMRVVPRTHTMAQVPHRDTFRPENLLSRGQEVIVEVDDSQADTLTLEAGEMSLHHVRLIHAPSQTSPTIAESDSPFAISRPMSVRSPAHMIGQPWCGDRTITEISNWSSAPMRICRRPRRPITRRWSVDIR